MRRIPTRAIALVAAAMLLAAPLLASTGCSQSEQTEESSSAGEVKSRGVLHVATVTEGRQPDQYEVAINPWKERTTIEMWVDLDSGATRESIVDTPTTTQVAGTHYQDVLTDDGVQTTLERSDYPPMPHSGSAGAYVRDPEPAIADSACRPLIDSGDPSIYRALEASGSATRVDETTDTVTLRVDTPIDDTTGESVLVTVRSDDYVPVRAEGEQWSTTTEFMRGTRAVVKRWVTDFETVEILSRDEVPDNTFELDIPDDTPLTVNRTLSRQEAAESTAPAVYWLGEEWEGHQRTTEPRLRASENSVEWGMPHYIIGYHGMEPGRDLAEQTVPFSEHMNPVVEIKYGNELAGVTVYCTGRFDIQKASAPFSENGGGVSDYLLDSGSAVLLSSPEETDVVTVAVELSNATVVLQCWRLTTEEALAAAEALRPIDEP